MAVGLTAPTSPGRGNTGSLQSCERKCVAAGGDPQTVTAGELAQGKPFTIGADASTGQVLRVMEEHRIRRLPVIDNHRLVGMISEADLARHLPGQSVAEFVEAICASS